MLKKKILRALGIVICAAAVIITIVFYSLFTYKHIFNESANHLHEIYGQVKYSFSLAVKNNWNLLSGWSDYIEDNENNEDALEAFIDGRREEIGFTNFYFLNEEGIGKPVKPVKGADGSVVYERNLAVSSEKIQKLKDGNSIVVDGLRAENTGENFFITLFAVPVKGGVREYQGFEYCALVIDYDSAAMTKMLSIDAFSGEGSCYIIDKHGEMLMSSEDDASVHFTNFLEHMKAANALFPRDSYEDIEKSILNCESATSLIKIHGTEYYINYQPIDFNEWLILGVVPSDILNSHMTVFRSVTLVVMAGIFILLVGAIITVVYIVRSRQEQENELKLKSRDSLFDMLTTNTRDIYILFSPADFTAEYVSPNVERLLGVDAELVHKDVRNILQATVNKPAAFTTEGLQRLACGQTWEADLRMHSLKSGEEFWYKLMLYRSELNGNDSFVMMLSDRTKEQSMKEHLEQALDITKAANSAKSNFLSNMSHDIRTPMNAIIGFSTLIAKDAYKPEKVLEYVRKITFSSRHLLSLINDILDMSKIESGKTSLNMEEFSFSLFLEELYSITGPQAKAKKQSFEMHTKGILPDVVLGDKLRLNQIMINLISNAVKYTPVGGEISVTIEAMEQKIHNHSHLKFIVKDNGIGMSGEYVKTIFDPFSREDTSVTKDIQGTGLGMPITKNIVELMGGTISVESEKGKGSTFTVELELATVSHVEDANFWVHHNIFRALVVDDDEEICKDIKELMDGTGVEISYALNGFKAVEMVHEACDKHQDYNIVLLDWKMPELSGVETAKRIRAKVGDEVPILVLTSYDFAEIEEEAKNAGIDFFLPKPFFVSNFRRAVSDLKDAAKQKAAVGEKKEITLKGLKILAAEDNEINAEILIDLLEMEEVECEVTSNGKEAVEKFTACKPGTYDLILMDVQMPVMNGYEATAAIRACNHPQAKTIPILAMTANAFDDDVKKALESGMNAHMSKPIDIAKMKETIARFKEQK